MNKYDGEFHEMKKLLYDKGYRDKDVTIISGKEMALGVLYAIPFVIALGMVYRFLLRDRAHLIEVGGLKFYLFLIVIIAISVLIHELLDGIGWVLSSGKGWSVVRFKINAVTPSCACKIALDKKQYLIGVLMPVMVLGSGSAVFLFVYPGTVSMLTVLTNFVTAGADLAIAHNIKKEKDALIAGHPTKNGYIAFYK